MSRADPPSSPLILDILGILTPSKVERAFEAILVILKSHDGKGHDLRLLVNEDEFSPILTEKSLIVSIAMGSMLWIAEEPKVKSGYTSFMLASDTVNPKMINDDTQKVDEVDSSVVNDSAGQMERFSGEDQMKNEKMSSTEFLLKNRKTSKKISQSNLKAFKKDQKKETTSFIINKKST